MEEEKEEKRQKDEHTKINFSFDFRQRRDFCKRSKNDVKCNATDRSRDSSAVIKEYVTTHAT